MAGERAGGCCCAPAVQTEETSRPARDRPPSASGWTKGMGRRMPNQNSVKGLSPSASTDLDDSRLPEELLMEDEDFELLIEEPTRGGPARRANNAGGGTEGGVPPTGIPGLSWADLERSLSCVVETETEEGRMKAAEKKKPLVGILNKPGGRGSGCRNPEDEETNSSTKKNKSPAATPSPKSKVAARPVHRSYRDRGGDVAAGVPGRATLEEGCSTRVLEASAVGGGGASRAGA